MRAYLVPIALCRDAGPPFAVAFLQRKDYLLGPEYCDKLLAIGGAVEPGEDIEQAVIRELEEEVPGWWRVATGCDAPAKTDLEPLFADEHITVFVAITDARQASLRAFSRGTQEGMPAALSVAALEALGDELWVYPQMRMPLLDRLRALQSAS